MFQRTLSSMYGPCISFYVWTMYELCCVQYCLSMFICSTLISCKWGFKKKTGKDENVHICKARLVVKGFKQIHGIDYDETFSPIAMLKSIRIFLAIATYFDYEIWQMDVKMTFLNGNLTEDVYMTQLEGFVDPKHAGKICKFQKFIYGMKQASQS
jgi:hypothetical protein